MRAFPHFSANSHTDLLDRTDFLDFCLGGLRFLGFRVFRFSGFQIAFLAEVAYLQDLDASRIQQGRRP
jgi:hypothetical protein